MIDFDGLVFGPVYRTFGRRATLTIGSSDYPVVVIDNTAGVTVEDDGLVGVQTIRPAVDVRRSTIRALGITVDRLLGGIVAFDELEWRIKSVVENMQELRLILMSDESDGDRVLQPHRLTTSGFGRITEAGQLRVLE